MVNIGGALKNDLKYSAPANTSLLALQFLLSGFGIGNFVIGRQTAFVATIQLTAKGGSV